ncbi:hypothetical protein COU54_04545 [Candidatus Pacearchaeota archaeon CG10_big_fil_rev_8_21_14_0_10_31_24]|nr:MAG: hypothetical protein COU54_04545 [Candidatus Pacearchaeota archaeon CG10_big_fil_rev_8_21_14_0_10_31_24]
MKKIRLGELLDIGKSYFKSEKKLDNKMDLFFKNQFRGDFIFTNRGMTAIQALIEDFNLENSEIIIPNFICSDVFSNLFKHNNIIPKIVDCEKDSFKISLKEVKKKITNKTKAIMIVHTLGIANNPEEFAKFCKKRGLILIENCAHCFHTKYKKEYLGSFGDASIFSFRSKEVRSFVGGMYLNNRRKISEKVRNKLDKFRYKREDLIRAINIFKISNLLSKIRRNVAPNAKFSNVGKKHEIYHIPKIGKALFCYHIENMDILKKKKMALKLYNGLSNKKIKIFISEKEVKEFSARSFPLMLKNRAEVYDKLLKLGLNPGKGWTPTFSENEFAKKKWNLSNTGNAEKYSRELLTISLDEINDKNIAKIVELLDFHKNKERL